MDALQIDALSSVKEVLNSLGIKDAIVQTITVVVSGLFLILFALKQISYISKYLITLNRKRILVKDLQPFYTIREIERATKYYIRTYYQNVSPTDDDEPGRNYIAAAREPLIPLFINNVFKYSLDDTKYYLVLADSGMGKTTFLINLYLAYKFKWTWFWQSMKFDILLLPLGHPATLEKVRSIPYEKRINTILLLDAFDEDNEAVRDYQNRLKEILNIVWEFRTIVMTCRTQFFPSSFKEPSETGKYKFGPDSGQFVFQKIYLSVFSEKDIKLYLRKRFKPFGFFKNSKYLKALLIVLKSPNLMMRPMLLSYIEDFIGVGKSSNYSFQIYETLIDQWLRRESNKAGIIEKYGKSYGRLLYDFSKAMARDLYINRQSRGNKLSIHFSEIINNANGIQLKDIEGNFIEIDKCDQSSRTLLNRDAMGEYKFAHKSIFEFFIAKEIIENEEFRRNFKFTKDLDLTKRFFFEMVEYNDLKIIEFVNSVNNLGLNKDEIKQLYFINLRKDTQTANIKSLFKAGLSLYFSAFFISGFLTFVLQLIVNYMLPYDYLENITGLNFIWLIFYTTAIISFLYTIINLSKIRKEMRL